MGDNQAFGEYRVDHAAEFRLYDALPDALREVLARAPFKYAVKTIAERWIVAHGQGLSARDFRAQLIQRMCHQLRDEARRTYGPDHPDAQTLRGAGVACRG